MTFFTKLLFGSNPTTDRLPRGAYAYQVLNLRRAWNNQSTDDFGVERLFRLFLILANFLFPCIVVRSITGRYGVIRSKLGVEAYVLLELLFLVSVLTFKWYQVAIIPYVVGYLLLETLVYLFAIIFLSDIYVTPISFKRSVLLLLINYIEVCLSFAVFYINTNCLNKELPSPLAATYFSFVTSATVGYDDFYPTSGYGYFLVTSQILIFVVFVVIFLNFFSSRIEDRYFQLGRGRKRRLRKRRRRSLVHTINI
jgi:hypothetical protein